MRAARLRALALLAGAAFLVPAAWAAPDEAAIARGARIYREGVLPDGSPLAALRENQTTVTGTTAACVNCHRRSGLGNVEGNYVVPPITARYLLRSVADNTADLDMPHVAGYHQGHAPYDDASLARAVREGVGSSGRLLQALMPRYTLPDAAMADLVAYLRQLGEGPFPGATDTTLQFATVITPDADPAERQAMLDVLQRFFSTQAEVIAAETRPMRAGREIKYRVTRQWRLQVWELHGAPDTWEEQLQDHMASEPVFALISGLGRSTWAPVHRFCERAHVPCLLPNIDLPVVHEKDFYPVYFSRGVLLEADLMAQWAAGLHPPGGALRRVVQVYRQGDIGAAAAAALAATQHAAGVATLERALPAQGGAAELARALREAGPDDLLVLWLRPEDLAALPPPPAATAVFSGLMGGAEAAPLPDAWRARAHMSYPLDLPQRRLARMNFPFGWFRAQHIPVTAERVQVDTYLACVITAETLGHVLDSFVPDYLLERMEMMISRRLANAYYPRLGLAPGQRFASKGGYVVHFLPGTVAPVPATLSGRTSSLAAVEADTDWMVP